VPNLFVMLMPHYKTERYLLPLQPVLALVSAYAFRKIINSARGKIVAALIIAAGIFQVYDLTYEKTGLSRLHFGDMYYWRTRDMDISFSAKLHNTALAVKISKALINDIQEEEKAGNAKKVYDITFIPGDWTMEAYTIRSYILLNSDRYIQEMQKPLLIQKIINGKDILNDMDYIVQMLPKGSPRVSICAPSSNTLKPAFENFQRLYPDFLSIQSHVWSMIDANWIGSLKNFKDRGLICNSSDYDVYLYKKYRRTANVRTKRSGRSA
jgi:hypothetical protein